MVDILIKYLYWGKMLIIYTKICPKRKMPISAKARTSNFIHHSKWLKVRTNDDFLCYIDDYNPGHNVVMGYDNHYHRKLSRRVKDVEKEKKIINILRPKKFWRYNSHTQSFTQTIEGSGYAQPLDETVRG